MAQVYKFSEKEIEEIVQARKENRDKRVEARLKALEMRARNLNAREIAEATGYHSAYISQLAAKYRSHHGQSLRRKPPQHERRGRGCHSCSFP